MSANRVVNFQKLSNILGQPAADARTFLPHSLKGRRVGIFEVEFCFEISFVNTTCVAFEKKKIQPKY